MADETRRWFADSSVSYSLAAIALLEYAREHRVRYVYGPLSTQAMKDGGLEVSGTGVALEQAARVLEAIPGLAEYQPDYPRMGTDWVTREDGAQDWAVREEPAEPELSTEQEGTPSGEEAPPAEDEGQGVAAS